MKIYENDENYYSSLALNYIGGRGVPRDPQKALSLIVEGAYLGSNICLKMLGDSYYCGDVAPKNNVLALFIYGLSEGKTPPAIYKYKAMTPTSFRSLSEEKALELKQEQAVLAEVVSVIDNDIGHIQSKIIRVDNETWWMNRDQLEDWRYDNQKNIENNKKIEKLLKIRKQPYYAKMVSSCFNGTESYYIGEELYQSHNVDIVSVWSEYGKNFRAKNLLTFTINGYQYKVILRRRYAITDGRLEEIFDEFVEGSIAANSQITDPYLIKVLENKKGESNITSIISSIQQRQNSIIEYDFNKSLIVQGCAGSGKTMVLLHRLANMHYCLPNLDLSKVKIITPNKEFSFYIDELSKNINIEKIERLTIDEYLIGLLNSYRNIASQKQSGNKKTGPSEKEEMAKVCGNNSLMHATISKIYSNRFEEILTKSAKSLSSNIDYGTAMNHFNLSFENAIKVIGIKETVFKNHTCVLYAKLLFMFGIYGELRMSHKMLCVDEAQDQPELMYILLKKINGKNLQFNLYGDINQHIPGCCGIIDWGRLTKDLGCELIELNENYRNSDNIIKHYNSTLGFNHKSFGLYTKPVEVVNFENLETQLKLQLILKNRTAVILKNPAILPPRIQQLCTNGLLMHNKVVLLTIIQSKGLEFDSVFVYEKDMGKNERYIAYSRALSELYIIK